MSQDERNEAMQSLKGLGLSLQLVVKMIDRDSEKASEALGEVLESLEGLDEAKEIYLQLDLAKNNVESNPSMAAEILDSVVREVMGTSKEVKEDSTPTSAEAGISALFRQAINEVEASVLETVVPFFEKERDQIAAFLANIKDGVDGKDGKDGVDGERGESGRDGLDGKDGKDGKDGESPTQKEVEELIKNGITGTFVKSLLKKQTYIGGTEQIKGLKKLIADIEEQLSKKVESVTIASGSGFSGDYNDLTNKPELGESDWGYYANKIKYTNLTGTITSGRVLTGQVAGTTVYRHITTAKTGLYPTEDSFYSSFDGTTLSGLIASR